MTDTDDDIQLDITFAPPSDLVLDAIAEHLSETHPDPVAYLVALATKTDRPTTH